MKTKKILLLLCIVVLSVTAFAQNPSSSVNIPVQGIARDANNTARINTDVVLTFEFYYLISGTEFPLVSPIVQTLPTDAFGVFSTTLNLGGDKSYLMANNQTYLRISEGSTIISNEILNHVPYAVSANNGVPTGSIMPYTGTTAPPGWLLCDGTAIPSGADYQPLRDVLGSGNTPNLRGMFLRGTGTSPVNGQAGPALNATQGDDNKSHAHFLNLNTNTTGHHQHTFSDRIHSNNSTLGLTGSAVSGAETNTITTSANVTNVGGAHSHNVQGNTFNSGTESRPVNYGVNYIIKL